MPSAWDQYGDALKVARRKYGGTGVSLMTRMKALYIEAQIKADIVAEVLA